MPHHHAHIPHGPSLTRRATLGGVGAALTLARLKPAQAAVQFPQRLLILMIPGGLDGLAAVVPYGDPYLAGLRQALIPPAVGQKGGMFDLGGFFGLNPNLPNLYTLYKANQMLAVHAVGNFINTRSHFQGQDVLELGSTGSATDGWVNRLVGLLPTVAGGVEAGLALGTNMPIGLQGPAPIGAFSRSAWPAAPGPLATLIAQLGAPDPMVGHAIQAGFADRMQFLAWLKGTPGGTSGVQALMQQAGTFLAAAGGPAVAMVTAESVDTHSNQNLRLPTMLMEIDSGMAAFATACGAAWANTVVLTMTEFGRTAYQNGSGGTDHGTAFAMFLAGGAVKGGRVIATWPGLSPTQLYEGRDLAITVDIRAVIMGVLQQHFGLTTTQLATIFPDATDITPMSGLVS
jgi:uncharacterized protein (DUF1501 family)